MPQIVEVVGYGPVQFPDGTTKAEMEEALRKLPPKKAPEPVAEQKAPADRNLFAEPDTVYDPVSGVPMGYGIGQKTGAALLSGAAGMLKPAAGAAQLMGITKPAEALERVSQTAQQIGGTPAEVADIAGQVASPIPLKIGQAAMRVAPGAGRALEKSALAKGAASGAGYAALTPVTEPFADAGDFLKQKAEQMAVGAGAGAALGKGAQMLLSPKVSPELQELQRMGMTTFTPGQLASQIPVVGRGLRATEQALTSLPLTGMAIRHGLEESAKDFNRAVANRVLEPMGQSVPKAVKSGEELVGYVNQRIEDAYDKITPKLQLSNVRYKDPNSASGFTTTIKALNDKLGEVVQDLPSSTALNLADSVRNEFNRLIIDPLVTKGSLTGKEFREAEKALGKIAFSYMRNPTTYEVGVALRKLQGEMRQELANQNPKLADELRGLHLAFRRHLPFERAAGYVGAEGRVFSPAQLESAIKAETKGKGQFASGQGLMYPEAQAALQIMGKTMPTSGTAERLLTAGQVAKIPEAMAAATSPQMLAPLAITSMLYNRPAMQGLTTLATRRPELMRQMASPAAGTLSRIGSVMSAQPNKPPLEQAQDQLRQAAQPLIMQ